MDITSFAMEVPAIITAKKNTEINLKLQDYYYQLGKNTSSKALLNLSENVKKCNQVWVYDLFRKMKVKDLIGTWLCHNKFCANCGKLRSGLLYDKYSRMLDEIPKDKFIYHLVLTIPSVSPGDLKQSIVRLINAFREFRRYLVGKSGCYRKSPITLPIEGGFRNLEVTFKNGKFHPHFHCILILSSPIGEKTEVNKFSVKFGEIVRLFSHEELAIQKLWECVYCWDKGVLSDFNQVEGYSCTMDRLLPGESIHELVKYIVKPGLILQLSYGDFVALHYALYGVRQIQGFGCLHNMPLEPVQADYEEQLKNDIREFLEYIETPIRLTGTLSDFEYDIAEGWQVINRNKAFQLAKDLEE